MVRTGRSIRGLFFPLITLTVFCILFEISFFIQCNQTYLNDFSLISSNLNIPWRVFPDYLFFLMVQLALHFLLVSIILFCTISIGKLFNLPIHFDFKLSIALFIWSWLNVLIANQYYYPHSNYAHLMGVFLTTETRVTVGFLLFSGISCIIIIASMVYWICTYPKTMLIASSVWIGLYLASIAPMPKKPGLFTPQSNVIIVGIDSLRPDVVGFFGSDTPTKFIDQFLTEATVFSEAITPIARTFPSWISLLTGKYPKQSGIRFNLAKLESLDLKTLLPIRFQKAGYATVYATDETRFSNMDKSLGFQHIIAPPMGINDFILGSFNDFPLSNLLLNTQLGAFLFPYTYANRGVFFAYDPNQFLKRIQSALGKIKQRPVFIAAHFCLPHYPYHWRAFSPVKTPLQLYQTSIARLDSQLANFFELLKAEGLLEKAVVVLLSDHGEALMLNGDRLTEENLFSTTNVPMPHFYPSETDETVNQSAGHGTDVMGLTQYHTLLAIRQYGEPTMQTKKDVTDVVSLIDIYPTLIELAQLEEKSFEHNSKSMAESSEGVSLAGYLKGKNVIAPSRHIFLESDFTPAAIRSLYPDIKKAILESLNIYEVNVNSMRLTVKSSMAEKIIYSKQYADIYQKWMLAFYPQPNDFHLPILINLESGQWTHDLSSSLAKLAPVNRMIRALKDHYGTEIRYEEETILFTD